MMFIDAISMVDFDFWAYENFECMVMMNVCCCSLNPSSPRISHELIVLVCCYVVVVRRILLDAMLL